MAMKTAFCCTSLKTGTVIIGWLTLMYAVFVLIVSTVYVDIQTKIVEANIQKLYHENMATVKPSTGTLLLVSGIIYLVSAVFIASTLCLLYGADKGRRGFLVPYLILFTLTSGLDVLTIVYQLCIGSSFALSIRLVYLVFNVYFLSVVGSFYSELNPANEYARHTPAAPLQTYPTNQGPFVEVHTANHFAKSPQYEV